MLLHDDSHNRNTERSLLQSYMKGWPSDLLPVVNGQACTGASGITHQVSHWSAATLPQDQTSSRLEVEGYHLNTSCSLCSSFLLITICMGAGGSTVIITTCSTSKPNGGEILSSFGCYPITGPYPSRSTSSTGHVPLPLHHLVHSSGSYY